MPSSIVNFKYGFAALAAEVSAWSGAWLLSAHSDVALLNYLVLHAASSVLLSLALLPLIPARYVASRRAAFALMVACCYAIPVLGFAGVIAAYPVLVRFGGKARDDPFESLQLPDFDPLQNFRGRMRPAGLRARLVNEAVPVAARVKAMAVLQSIAGDRATPILYDVLHDSNEELRLLAYGMLNRFETRIGRDISEQLRLLEAAAPDSRVALRSARNLSDLYWQMVSSGLARDDLRVHAMGESMGYCEQVLSARPNDGPMQLRRARLLYEVGNRPGAEGAYGFARALGMPPVRVLPNLARLHFEQREFAQVRELMHELKDRRALPRLRLVIDYWGRA